MHWTRQDLRLKNAEKGFNGVGVKPLPSDATILNKVENKLEKSGIDFRNLGKEVNRL